MDERLICPVCKEDITEFYTDEYIGEEGELYCANCGCKMLVECEVAIVYKVTPLFEKE